MIVPATGGGFGAKSQVYPEYMAVATLARRLGRPVRWVEDRAEAIVAATRGRGQHQRTRLAASADGQFLAYELLVPITLGETRTPNPNVPFGAKGAGEAGCIGVPPAVVNAVCDALDVDHIDMPLTPEAVWRAATASTGGVSGRLTARWR